MFGSIVEKCKLQVFRRLVMEKQKFTIVIGFLHKKVIALHLPTAIITETTTDLKKNNCRVITLNCILQIEK